MKNFTNEEIDQFIIESNKKWQLLDKLNIKYAHRNGTVVDLEFIPYLQQIGLDSSFRNWQKLKTYRNKKIKENYYKNPRICECGKIITFEKRFNKYCSQSCGTKYSNLNKGNLSEETRKRISETLKLKGITFKQSTPEEIFKHYLPKAKNTLYEYLKSINYEFTNNYLVDIDFCIKNGLILNVDNFDYSELNLINSFLFKKTKCKHCGKIFYGKISKNNKAIGYGKTCCNNCRKESMRNSVSKAVQKRKENGTFQGWKPRNNRSYPEKFWMKVLENNNIPYISEYPIERKGTQNYFLDFYIEKNGIKIDLEIDGKQHKYEDRLKADKIRDEYVKNLGFIVYRIDWNRMNGSKELSDLTKKKD